MNQGEILPHILSMNSKYLDCTYFIYLLTSEK